MTPILCALGLVVFLLALVVAGRPDDFVVSRSACLSAPADRLFSCVNDFRKWNEWSPWAKLDPDATNTYAGPEAGEGAAMSWSGNGKVGAGRMTIVESRPETAIRIRLEFEKPMKATNSSAFTFVPEGTGTRVTWTMNGTNSLVGKLFSVIFDCDQMVGSQFMKGLASLERVASAR